MPFLGGPVFHGQIYQQTYDSQTVQYVGDPVRIPFRDRDANWSCAALDDRFVVYSSLSRGSRLAFAPTGVSTD
jgi:hypothetical protein